MTEHWSWLTGSEAGEYTYSPPSRPSRPPHRPLVKLATSAHLHTIASQPHGTEQMVTMRRLVKITLVLIVYAILKVDSSKDVIKEMSKTFAKPIEACRKEIDLTESVMNEFMNFWKADYVLSDRLTGCAIICLSSKLELLDADYNLHHGNAQDFIKKHGGDDKTANQLVELIHGCTQKFPEMPDACDRTLKIANCFKAEIHKLDWAPSIELIMADVLAET